MKIWPFDAFASSSNGTYISFNDVEKGLEPIKKIRDAVGLDMEVMMEGHGLWKLPAAVRIAEALEPYKPMWLEDFIKPDNVDTLAQLRQSTSTPICGSELALTRHHARDLLERRAVDILMTDVTWTGGLTESRKIAAMADSYNLPFATHDCTGPVTLMASIHLSLHCQRINTRERHIIIAVFIATSLPLNHTSKTASRGHQRSPDSASANTSRPIPTHGFN